MAAPHPTTPYPARWQAATLVALLAAHAALLGTWLARLPGPADAIFLPLRELATALAVAVACVVVPIVAFPRAARRAVTLLVLALACALLGVGAVAAVLLTALSAHVVGSALLDRVAADRDAGASATTRIMVGSALWIGLIAATLPLPVHRAPVYALAVAGSLAVFSQATRRGLAAAWQWLAAEEPASRAERACIALAGIVAILHVLVVAKPEVGFDASTMHLQFVELVARDHAWHFDVTRYAWAVMPMGADDAFLAAFLLAGEHGARAQNLLFGALLCIAAYDLLRREASGAVALASVALLASTPLWFLESGTLFVEFAWTAFLVVALGATIRFARDADPATLAAALVAAAGAMACKVIAVFFVAPLAVVLLVLVLRGPPLAHRGRLVLVALAAFAIAAWPYANAWARTGNPLFPFLNDVFRSPYFPASASFNNPLYNAPLALSTPYALVMQSGRFIEGYDGAMGTQWLLLFPLVACGVLFVRTRLRAGVLALALGFAIAVYVQQSYLRYLLPAFVLLTILAGWSLRGFVASPRGELRVVAAATALALANVALMPAASWSNATLCLRCAFDAGARRDYVANYAPLRGVVAYLNANLPDARVGFLVPNAPAPDGYLGYSRAANWHDAALFYPLLEARTADDVAALVRRFGLTHAVFRERASDPLDPPLLAWRDRDTIPIARIDGYVVATVRDAAQRGGTAISTR